MAALENLLSQKQGSYISKKQHPVELNPKTKNNLLCNIRIWKKWAIIKQKFLHRQYKEALNEKIKKADRTKRKELFKNKESKIRKIRKIIIIIIIIMIIITLIIKGK